jgi:hypothetical protein
LLAMSRAVVVNQRSGWSGPRSTTIGLWNGCCCVLYGNKKKIRWEVGFSFLLCSHVVGHQVGSWAESLPGSAPCSREFPRERRFAAPTRAVRFLAACMLSIASWLNSSFGP